MKPWESLAETLAPDGQPLVLRRRGHEYLIYAGGHDLMSSEDDVSSKALGALGCAHLAGVPHPRVLVGGLGMGYTLRAALDCLGPDATVEVAELVDAVVAWNRAWLGDLAGRPLEDPRTHLMVLDVSEPMRAPSCYDAILLDVDNGPDALAHPQNEALYSAGGIARAHAALRPGGVLGIWSFDDDPGFTRRLEHGGFEVTPHRVSASRKGRGRYHQVWIARRREP